MNILLLGNGYDLNFKLPTAYRDFLLTVDFLLKCNLENIHTVGDVFGNSDLQKEDKFIECSYQAYQKVYDNIELDAKTLQELVERAKANIWFSYFVKSFNRVAGWIDVEREIAFVISRLQSFFDKADVTFVPNKDCDEIGAKYIIMKMFNFFVSKVDYSGNTPLTNLRRIKPEYTTEYPLGSGDRVINKDKIIQELNDALIDFIDILKTYLKCFVDKSVEELVVQGEITQLQALNYADAVITFNYTNTFETLDSDARVFHIHGNVNDKIVLGVNPDKNDEKNTISTDFIAFKKYYQRTYYGTDITYLRWLREGDAYNNDVHLLIMGHSLDVTDEDIIRGLFELASEITVIYHNEHSKSKHIRNLVNIFGKEKFDKIRNEQQLDFLPLSMDFSSFSKRMADNSLILYQAEIRNFFEK